MPRNDALGAREPGIFLIEIDAVSDAAVNAAGAEWTTRTGS
jgi:hypothetical protein